MTRSCPRYQTLVTGESLTEQHHKDACNVNNIIRRFETSGVLDHLNPYPQQFGYASSQTFDEAARMVTAANQTFESFPSAVRQHFGNNTAAFLDALEDPLQQEALQDLGLIPKPAENDSKDQIPLDLPPAKPPVSAPPKTEVPPVT